MKQNETETNANLNSTIGTARPSAHHIERDQAAVVPDESSSVKHVDDLGMESAKRAQNRLHRNEERTPDNSIFSK